MLEALRYTDDAVRRRDYLIASIVQWKPYLIARAKPQLNTTHAEKKKKKKERNDARRDVS